MQQGDILKVKHQQRPHLNTSFEHTESQLDYLKPACHRISDIENIIREQWTRLHTSPHYMHSVRVYICLY
jgi:hypothetical protein